MTNEREKGVNEREKDVNERGILLVTRISCNFFLQKLTSSDWRFLSRQLRQRCFKSSVIVLFQVYRSKSLGFNYLKNQVNQIDFGISKMNKLVLIPILSLCLLLSGIESLENYQGSIYSTSDTDPRGVQPKYTFESLGQLALRDIIRWAYILEDLTSEILQRQFFEGIVDKKTIKLGIRFLVQKLYNMLREQNVIPDEFSYVQFLWPPPFSSSPSS